MTMRLVVFGLVTAVAVIGLTSAIAVQSVQQWAIFALLAAAWLASATSCALVLRGLRAERRPMSGRESARPTDR
ncbi:hypothetical protein [Leifsonia aquatica]|uniref:hypothetical protein n=1 Tax=Leifsonia aquatica TaxID=144185 RepID=UPI00046ADDCF|nr:hypothetical protein [Leifsonia aquatica]